jgi:hypothetical protein
MKRYILLFFSVAFVTTASISQTQDSIIYILPDSVEIIINEHILSWRDKSKEFYCVMSKKEELYEVSVCPYSKESFLISNTNRFVIVNNRKIPVFFDYDIAFWVEPNDLKSLGVFGSRFDGFTKGRYMMFHCFIIKFSRNGRKISISEW